MSSSLVNSKLLLLSVLLLFSVVGYFLVLDVSSNFVNFFSFAFMCMLSWVVLRARGGWLLFLYIFALAFSVGSGALVECFNSYLFEIRQYADLTGAAARNAFLSSYFMLGSYLFFRLSSCFFVGNFAPLKGVDFFTHKFMIFLAWIFPAYLFIVLLVFGSPLFIGMDRFSYMSSIAPIGYSLIYGLIPIFALVISLGVRKGFISRWHSAIWLSFSCFAYAFGGEKFSKFILLLFFFLLPSFVLGAGVKKVHLLLFVVLVGVLVALVLINYHLIYGGVDVFVPRLSVQGQMNYALDRLAGAPQSLLVISKALLGINASSVDRGMPFLMYLVAPSDIVELRLGSGVSFTVPFPANFAFFGGVGYVALYILPLSALVGIVSAVLYKSVVAGNLLLSVASAKTYLMLYYSVIMGNLDVFLSWKGFMHIMLILFLVVVSSYSVGARS